jgi:hypothetical protein
MHLGTAISLRIFLLHALLIQAIGFLLGQSATSLSIVRRTGRVAKGSTKVAFIVLVRGVRIGVGGVRAVGLGPLLLVKKVGSGDGHGGG